MIFIRENIVFFVIWGLAVFFSFISFVVLTSSYPTTSQFLLGHTLYAIPGMPNAFLHMIRFYDDVYAHNDLFFYALAALYWMLIIVVHYWHAQERELKYVLVIAVIVLVSSFKWLYFASSFMQ